MTAPKLFISYSWTSPDHESWVLQLANELQESGVDVILDKWNLKEGHDAHVFMEQMVTDKDINKVALICDHAYVTKTDLRAGGVGNEAQIISSKIYESSDQEKFVAIVKERDESNKPLLPVYYKSRIYIDLSDNTTYSDNFDRLLRWVFDKPLYKKPPIGKMPTFLTDGESTKTLATSTRCKRAMDAIKSNRENADGAVKDYFDVLVLQLEELRISGVNVEGEFDDDVMECIAGFLPYRNEAIELFEALAKYRDSAEMRHALHRFFEGLIPYMSRPLEMTVFQEWDFDNFRYIIHELFLYCVAILLKNERFESASYLMSNEYYVPGRSDFGYEVMVPFETFRQHMQSLEHRNQRLNLNRLSVRADTLEQRCKGIGVPFRDLLQADFVLYLRDHLDRPKGGWHWFPETLVYVRRSSAPFEIFARSRSAIYFDKVKNLLGISSKTDIAVILDVLESGGNRLPRWGFDSFSPRALLGFEEIETKP